MLASPPPHKDFTLSPPHMLLLRRVEQEGFSCALLSMWELGPMKLRGVVDSPRPHSKMAAGGRPGLLLPLFFFGTAYQDLMYLYFQHMGHIV